MSKALTSVNPDHPELLAAHAAGIPATSCQQLIADAAASLGGTLLAIAGTHGKSTTTGWLVHLLNEAGEDPSAFVGALLPAALVGGMAPAVVRLGRPGGPFVVEADEYAGNFDPYRPSIGVLLNADWDHPDVFPDRAAVVDVFEAWIRRFGPNPTLVANAGDPGVATLLPRLADWPGRILATAVAPAGESARSLAARLGSDVRSAGGPAATLTAEYDDAGLTAVGRAMLVIHGLPGRPDGASVEINLAGRHNADDALGAVGAALAYGLAPGVILDGLASFEGVGRRFEIKADIGGIVVIDDYGHHPTAIAATLGAVAQRYPGPPPLGGLRAAHFPPHRRAARAVRRRPGDGRSGGDRRHLRRARSGPDDRLGGRPGPRGRAAGDPGDRPGIGRGNRRGAPAVARAR